jgi:NADPH:quinone reductase
VAGSELAGMVVEAPADSWLKVGDRVAGIVVRGAMAEFALAAEDYLVRIPDGMSCVEAAGIYMNYATAWFAFERMAISVGDSVLITGAAGGVGCAALDLARVYGYESIGLLSSAAKEDIARSSGVRHVLRVGTGWLEQVRELTEGKGVHGLMDMVGGDDFTDALRALRIGGRGVIVGFASGRIPEVKTNR